MKSANVSLFALLLATCAPATAVGPGPATVPRSDTDAFCAVLEATRTATPTQLFGSVQPDPTRAGIWKTYLAERSLKNAIQAGEVYDSARLWKTDRGALVSLGLSSGSGDWSHRVDYCFRADGSLARSLSTLNTFNVSSPDEELDPVSREQTRYFDGRGNQVELQRRVLDLKTKQPAPEREGQFMDEDEPRIHRIEDLPFGKLLP